MDALCAAQVQSFFQVRDGAAPASRSAMIPASDDQGFRAVARAAPLDTVEALMHDLAAIDPVLQVDVLGLFGRMLDRMLKGQKPAESDSSRQPTWNDVLAAHDRNAARDDPRMQRICGSTRTSIKMELLGSEKRAAYEPTLITDDEQRFFNGLLRKAEGLTCLEFVRVFSLALKPGTDPEAARFIAQWLFDHREGLDALYDREREPRPTFPNVVRLRAA